MKWILKLKSQSFEAVPPDEQAALKAWDTEYIPHGPTKDDIKSFKKALEDALCCLDCGRDKSLVLDACFSQKDNATIRSDIENVLFYNLRATPFSKSAKNGLRFRQGDWEEQPMDLGFEAAVFYSYALVKKSQPPKCTTENNCILSLKAEFPTKDYLENWAPLWFAIKEGMRQGWATAYGNHRNEKFGVFVTLHPPEKDEHGGRNLAGIVKPTFDAVVCAMDFHNGPVDGAFNVIIERLRERLNVDSQHIEEYLRSEEYAVLGGCNLVRRHGRGIACNPSDHLCTEGELLLGEAKSANWALTAKVFRKSA